MDTKLSVYFTGRDFITAMANSDNDSWYFCEHGVRFGRGEWKAAYVNSSSRRAIVCDNCQYYVIDIIGFIKGYNRATIACMETRKFDILRDAIEYVEYNSVELRTKSVRYDLLMYEVLYDDTEFFEEYEIDSAKASKLPRISYNGSLWEGYKDGELKWTMDNEFSAIVRLIATSYTISTSRKSAR